jgi:cytochrome oxidase Cu insertion factor (SCO1/SenC/PrrC family)
VSVRGRRLVLVLLVLAAIIAVISVAAPRRTEKRTRLEAGTAAPPLAGAAVRGRSVRLDRLHGHVVLLSFLNSRAEATPEGDPSRAQIVFLRSMQRQHARFGLHVIVVDAAELAGAGRPSRNDLVNYTYDWNLDPAIAVLPDDGTFARRYAVEHAPTTFLIGRDGVVRQRWDGFAPAARLDLAIRRLEGRGPTG